MSPEEVFLITFSKHFLFTQTLLDRTGYSVEVTVGQRKYGGPPPDYTGDDISKEPGHEVGYWRPLIPFTFICYARRIQ